VLSIYEKKRIKELSIPTNMDLKRNKHAFSMIKCDLNAS